MNNKKFEKNIIKILNSKEDNTLEDLYDKKESGLEVGKLTYSTLYCGEGIVKGTKTYLINKNQQKEILNHSRKIINVIKKLHKIECIDITANKNALFFLSIKKDDKTSQKPFHEFHNLMEEYNRKTFSKTNELKRYKNFGYKTKKERQFIIGLFITVIMGLFGIFKFGNCESNKNINPPQNIDNITPQNITNDTSKIVD